MAAWLWSARMMMAEMVVDRHSDQAMIVFAPRVPCEIVAPVATPQEEGDPRTVAQEEQVSLLLWLARTGCRSGCFCRCQSVPLPEVAEDREWRRMPRCCCWLLLLLFPLRPEEARVACEEAHRRPALAASAVAAAKGVAVLWNRCHHAEEHSFPPLPRAVGQRPPMRTAPSPSTPGSVASIRQ